MILDDPRFKPHWNISRDVDVSVEQYIWKAYRANSILYQFIQTADSLSKECCRQEDEDIDPSPELLGFLLDLYDRRDEDVAR